MPPRMRVFETTKIDKASFFRSCSFLEWLGWPRWMIAAQSHNRLHHRSLARELTERCRRLLRMFGCSICRVYTFLQTRRWRIERFRRWSARLHQEKDQTDHRCYLHDVMATTTTTTATTTTTTTTRGIKKWNRNCSSYMQTTFLRRNNPSFKSFLDKLGPACNWSSFTPFCQPVLSFCG